MALGDLTSPDVIGQMFKATPGGRAVSYGGVTSYGHFEDLTDELFEDQPLVSFDAVLTIPTGALPGIGPELPGGTVRGVGEDIEVEDPSEGLLGWTIRAIRSGESPGELRLLLANR